MNTGKFDRENSEVPKDNRSRDEYFARDHEYEHIHASADPVDTSDNTIASTHVGSNEVHYDRTDFPGSTKNEWRQSAEQLLSDISLLVDRQKRLMKTELNEKGNDLKSGFESLGVGAGIMIMFLFSLTALIIVLLEMFMPLWGAVAMTTLLLGIIGYAAVRSGTNKLSFSNLTPEKSVDTLNQMARRLKESYYALRHS